MFVIYFVFANYLEVFEGRYRGRKAESVHMTIYILKALLMASMNIYGHVGKIGHPAKIFHIEY